MTAHNRTLVPISSVRRQARWLRRIAAVVVLLGIFGAELMYWLRTRSVDSPDILPVAGEDKSATRQAQLMMGQQAVLVDEWGRDLKRPGTQAVIIVVTAGLVAGGCFYFARLLNRAEQRSSDTGTPE
jgi:hypothetical protein